MDTRLPLKLRTSIRDYWDSEDAAVNKAKKALQATLGLELRVNPEWGQLATELEKAYPDRENLVKIVAGCVEMWCKVLTELLDGADDDAANGADAEAQQQWADTLLDRVKPGPGMQLHVEVATEAGTSWSADAGGFVLTMPKRAVKMPTEFAGLYRTGLRHCFDVKKAKTGAAADEWADVEMDRSTGKAAVVDRTRGTAAKPTATRPSVSEYLPSVDTLPCPDDLLLRPPYHITVTAYSWSEVRVTCSHSASLKLLSDYLKRWARLNHNHSESPSAVKIDIWQSCFSTGCMYDRLVLSTEDTRNRDLFTLTPTIVLAFVEGVLGYKRVSVHGSTWTYCRDVEIKG